MAWVRPRGCWKAGSLSTSADELETGRRSEGGYYAVFWWFLKMGMAGAYLAAGLLFEASGFDEQADTQSARTLLLMRVFEIGVPCLLGLGSVVLVLRYPLSEARAYEIKEALEKRRAARGVA